MQWFPMQLCTKNNILYNGLLNYNKKEAGTSGWNKYRVINSGEVQLIIEDQHLNSYYAEWHFPTFQRSPDDNTNPKQHKRKIYSKGKDNSKEIISLPFSLNDSFLQLRDFEQACEASVEYREIKKKKHYQINIICIIGL